RQRARTRPATAARASTASTRSRSRSARRPSSCSRSPSTSRTRRRPVSTYRDSGVDLEAAAQAVSMIRDLARDVTGPEVAGGVAEGCRLAGCALLGGETAEHPGAMEPGQFDLAGFCVGIVDEAELIGPHRVEEGDLLIGLASSGLHSNGFSLVRSWLESSGYFLRARPEGIARRLEAEAREPTRELAAAGLRLA